MVDTEWRAYACDCPLVIDVGNKMCSGVGEMELQTHNAERKKGSFNIAVH